jgi:hypothetical protein
MMRKLLVPTLATWLALLGAGGASADVSVLATIDKEKDVVITEAIRILKTVDLDVVVPLTATKAAESDALVNQTNAANRSCTNCDEKRDTITNSGNANSGVLSINQAAGNMNNQGNAVSIAVDVIVTPGPGQTPPPSPDPQSAGFAEAQASVDQRNGAVRDLGPNTVDTVNLLFRSGTIATSLNTNTGVVHANQAPGNMNNQANALSVAVSLDGGVALSEADLGQVNVGNVVRESDATSGSDLRVGINKRAEITGSINGNTGIVGVNQAVGNMANQANVVSVAAALAR